MADSAPPPLNPISQGLLPIPPAASSRRTPASLLNSVSPGLLPTPPATRRLLGTAAFPSVSGRASASQSWIRDKSGHATVPTNIETTRKIPGRASLSENWVRDKLRTSATTVSATVSAPTTNLAIGLSTINLPVKRIGADSGLSSADSCFKKPRYEFLSEDSGSESEPEDSFYAGPAFLTAPHPSCLPMPIYLLSSNANLSY
jgi:hypothetical protein